MSSSRGILAPKFSFSALEVEGGDDDSSHTESDGELVEAPTLPPPKPPPPAPEKTTKVKGSKAKGKITPTQQRSATNLPAVKDAAAPSAEPPSIPVLSNPLPMLAAAAVKEKVDALLHKSSSIDSIPATSPSPPPAAPPTTAPSSSNTGTRRPVPPLKPQSEIAPSGSNSGPTSAATTSTSPLSSVRFHPNLPTLPLPPPSPGLRLEDRKRKASQDLIVNPLKKESKLDDDAPSSVNITEKGGNISPKSPTPPKSVAFTQDAKPATEPDTNAEMAKKKQNAMTRTIWTLIMIGGFIAILLLGHPYIIVLVFVCQTLAYREVTALFRLTVPAKEREQLKLMGRTSETWDSTLNWYFFAVTNYFLYGETIIYYFKHVVFSDAQFLPFATNHRFISFMLYIIGFVGFVASLKKQYLKHQFGLFCWVHMSLLVLVVSSHFIVNNILEGLIWFWVPASLVICNDIWAYICGVTFGRTPLLKLSPKKTVEGFIGAFICTLIFAVLWGSFFMRYPYMICPVRDLGTSAFSDIQCRPNAVFIWRHFELWSPLNAALTSLLGRSSAIPPIPYNQFQLHCLVFATFASLVAPFGGFFASGFKRAFDLKDFGDSIPGHGGMTDRMDCQFMMGVFSYVYYSALVREHHVTVGSVLQTIVSNLDVEEQIELFVDLKRYLEKLGAQIPA